MAELNRLAGRLAEMKPSPTLALNALAQQMQKQGVDVVNLTAGETDFPTPEPVKEATIQAIKANKTRYTGAHGTPVLRARIARWFQERWDLPYSEKEVTVTAGVKQGIFDLVLALLEPGDEVIIPAPYWVSYPELVKIVGAKPVVVTTKPEQGFRINPDDIAKAITPKTRMLILNSPNNPTGAMQTNEDLRALAKALEGTNVIVLSDEIYAELSYTDQPYLPFAKISEDAYRRTITMNGLSKSHAMTGWRVGFLGGDSKIIEAVGVLQGQSISNITTFVQDGAVAALDTPREKVLEMRDVLKKKRDFVLEFLRREPKIKLLTPPGAFYCFPDVSAWYGTKSPQNLLIKDSGTMAEYLLKEALLAVVPGQPFGEDRCIRLSFATDLATLERGCDRLLKALQALKA